MVGTGEPIRRTLLSGVRQRDLSKPNLGPNQWQASVHFPGRRFSPINLSHVPACLTDWPRAALGEKQASCHLVGTPQTFALLIGRCLIKRQVSCCHLHYHFQGETWAPCSSPKALHQPKWLIKYFDSCFSEHGSLPAEVCGSRQKYPWNGPTWDLISSLCVLPPSPTTCAPSLCSEKFDASLPFWFSSSQVCILYHQSG